MRRFHLRELWRVNCEGLIRAAGQNLKRLLKKRGWGGRPCPAEAVFVLFLAVCGWMTRNVVRLKLFSCPLAQMIHEQEGLQSYLLMSFDEDFFNRLGSFTTWWSRIMGWERMTIVRQGNKMNF